MGSGEKIQKIVLSGIGGQGVLFITRILAQVAIDMGFPALVSETHGMAQRGGTVVSHLKIGDFKSPLIRSGQADVLICFHEDNVLQHDYFLKENGVLIVNSTEKGKNRIDATSIASRIGAPIAANLVVLGYALANGCLFCKQEVLEGCLQRKNSQRLEQNLAALKAGISRGKNL